jgi:hypothetical protein
MRRDLKKQYAEEKRGPVAQQKKKYGERSYTDDSNQANLFGGSENSFGGK